ncbi:MAG: hypothetical protein OZSIB_1951 [Candidatus Ozemobacter sibiricus]|jgi:hypothetical protein|uniref:Outer membrane beta-barrel protein n=1 Tax=Candidatus Ozemobacter sibiricus TaxID=2268124 RepID=A0A367ZIG8_9BACT|nr:MAG: hypothetical protein OZSIB_1951 [Candidatus Ozemobacter sibiricus]
MLAVVAGLFLYLGSGFTASSLQTLDPDRTYDTEPWTGPAALPGVFTNFNPRTIPELQAGRPTPEKEPAPGLDWLPAPRAREFGSHRVPFHPPSEVAPGEMGTSLPLVDRLPPGYTDLNEREDDRVFSSNLYTDTTIYGNWVDKNKHLSSKTRGTFYEQNLRYDLYTTRANGDSLAVVVDTVHNNDKREYKEGFTLNQLTVESRTARSLLSFGHSYPEFTPFTMTQQQMGLYGVQRFQNTEVRTFTGYKAVEKDDLKTPRLVSGLRVEHRHDDAVTIGLNAVGTRDVHDNPGADRTLPTIRNKVYSMDVSVRPTENIWVDGEYARSDTDFDRRVTSGNQLDTAFRFKGGYGRENYRAEAGVEQAGTAFLTYLGESPRDERAFFGNFFYELNRYVSTRIGGRSSRDNLDNYKRDTLVRNQPEVQVTVRPSDYYRDLRVDFFYQPLHEYSDNTRFVDRYRDLMWVELNHRAGALRYFAGLSSTIDKDKVARINDRDINRFDLKLTWEYDSQNRLYGLVSQEQLSYKVAGGQDVMSLYGFGGHSQFHEDVSLNLDFTHELNDPANASWDSKHDRLNLSLTKEYNNMARLILDLQGSSHRFTLPGRDYSDLTAKLRFLRSF